MHQLKYLDEIRPMDEIDGIDTPQKVDAKELSLGKTLVDNLTVESLILDSILKKEAFKRKVALMGYE